MASEIRVDKITHTAGVGTITPSPTGVHIAGIVTGTTFSGSGASLTSLPAAQLSGTLPAISGANLTNLTATNLTGTIADARFPATLPAVSAANLTSIPAANVTGTLPAISAANLTNIPAANIVGVATAGLTKTGGFGAILQVVKTNVTASSSYGSSANSHYTLTPLNTTITPVGTNSHFIVSAQISGEPSANSNANIFIRLIRNTTSGFADGNNVAIAVGDNGSNNTAPENTSAFHGYYAQNNDSTISTTHITNYVDSPSVSAGGDLQYKVQIYIQESGTTFYLNRTVTQYNQVYGDYLPSFLTVMEIAA